MKPNKTVRAMPNFDDCWRRCLDGLDKAGRLRILRDTARRADGTVDRGSGRVLLDFSSNDALGLSHHPALIAGAQSFAAQWGTGSGGSRLVSGNLPPFAAIEAKVARAKGSEAALLLASGFQANATILPALFDSAVLGAPPQVFADRLNHASLIHGCLAAGVRQKRYRHNDLGHLETLLAAHPGGAKFIVSETVFSMEGDRVDIAALAALARKYDAFLYLDDAHATGTLGEHGFGLARKLDGTAWLAMGTFSKAMGGFGAYVACSAVLRDYLVNRCWGLVYATALPPPVLGAIDAAVELLPALTAERACLAAHGNRLRAALAAAGLDCGPSSTHIVPVLLGKEETAMRLAAALDGEGMLAVAIRPPTVPRGTSRLRLSLSVAHADADLDRLIETLVRLARPS
jgi:8-amino-7-oxononanoate synthase